MELRQLRYFAVLAEELHFRRAAERLHMTQPPLSQSIKLLEEELGAQLLERGRKRHVKLTAAGQTFLASAKRILEEAERAKQGALLAKDGEAGVLTIYHTDDYISDWFPDLLVKYNQQYPGVYVESFQGLSTRIADRLNSGELDCAFTTQPLPATLAECVIRHLPATPIVAVMPDTHPLSKSAAIQLSELANEKHLHSSASLATPFDIKLEQLLVKSKIRLSSALAFSNSVLEMEMVRRGHGITFSTLGSIPTHVKGVMTVPLDHPDAQLERALVWRKDNPNPTLQRFLELTDTMLAEQGEALD